MPATSYARLQNAAVAVGNGAEMVVAGLSAVGFQVLGTFVGTVLFEASVNGIDFQPLEVFPAGGGPSVQSATAPGVFQASVAGMVEVRARVSAYTSGSITVEGFASEGASIEEAGGDRMAVVAAPTFTRPADVTAYASGDLVANNTVAGSVVALVFSTAARIGAGNGAVRRARIRKSGTGVANAAFRLHLYTTAAPTVTNGDNGAWLSTGSASYLGSIDITVDKAFSDGAAGQGAPAAGAEINFALASGQTLWGLLEARGAYTPANAETFSVSLEVDQN